MDHVASPHTLLLDFDGVLSLNASELLLHALHEGINRHTAFPFEATAAQFKAISTFPQRDSLRALFAGLGIEQHLDTEIEALRSLISAAGRRMTLSEGVERFCAEQRARGRRLRVFSTMDRTTARRSLLDGLFGPEDFVPLGHASKADSHSYTALLAAEGEPDPGQVMLVDDSPLALRAAKIAGVRTALMRGQVFTPADVAPFAPFIDAQVASFAELGALLRSAEPLLAERPAESPVNGSPLPS
ncbi:HAD family hydrolase [Nocardiopsis gilva YIM 90087]|uniref:HAD family hydrolase n=1 Tax=Nocardiopsis gilva YIM 90087 TaxID=1235441 RepID=A0A223S1A0_9ACTN|nr:HAD family hydrolase [Nocardiopsis gilva]ASU81884.1 HAD family hydrolase [Nocardiopsis gilva YIM 90087]